MQWVKTQASTEPGKITTSLLDGKASRQPSGELLGFYAALANRHNAPCDILVLGDSFVEGQGATTIGNRWLDLFRDRIRERFLTPGITGGVGFIPATSAAATPTGQGFTVTGNTAGSFLGIGARARILGPTAGSGPGALTITRTCTSFDVHYKTDVTAASFTVTIDGGAPVTVTGLSGEQVWKSSALADAPHTIVISQSGGGNLVYVEGVNFYRGDESKGIRVWDGGRAGSRTGNYVTGGTFGTGWAESVVKVGPELVIIAFGTNDCAQVSPAQFTTDLYALVALVRSKAPNVPIALMPPFQRVSPTLLSPWSDYVAGARTVADSTEQCVFLNAGDRFPAPSPDTYSLLSDGLHPNNKGHALLADVYMTLLAPAGN